ncbi:GNAT family N-acetyltransferase [Myroides sp. LJL119]
MLDSNLSITPYKQIYRSAILNIWENSVKATHDFLSAEDFIEIKKLVENMDFTTLDIYCLTFKDQVLGFIGIFKNKVEMLFIDPKYFREGFGRKLLEFAIKCKNAYLVDVNQQNHQAFLFYKKLGFHIIDRSEKDDQGRDYPILKLSLKP